MLCVSVHAPPEAPPPPLLLDHRHRAPLAPRHGPFAQPRSLKDRWPLTAAAAAPPHATPLTQLATRMYRGARPGARGAPPPPCTRPLAKTTPQPARGQAQPAREVLLSFSHALPQQAPPPHTGCHDRHDDKNNTRASTRVRCAQRRIPLAAAINITPAGHPAAQTNADAGSSRLGGFEHRSHALWRARQASARRGVGGGHTQPGAHSAVAAAASVCVNNPNHHKHQHTPSSEGSAKEQGKHTSKMSRKLTRSIYASPAREQAAALRPAKCRRGLLRTHATQSTARHTARTHAA